MLREVLQAVEAAKGPITLNELSRRLELDPRVLDGMLEHWSRRGKLVVDGVTGTACAGDMTPARCSCGSATDNVNCPFLARLPKSYSLSSESDIPTATRET
ncbi:MAG: hypothetical protein KA586_10370 [Candidatus Promineofilum sp.]|nr:hypothetical protein [Promineifilum sp.]